MRAATCLSRDTDGRFSVTRLYATCTCSLQYVVNLVSLQTDYVFIEVLKYLYAKCVDVSVSHTMHFFVSDPKLATSYISKSVLVFGPVAVEVQGSVVTVH